MLNPYMPAWNSSLKPVLTPMTDITTACGSVMVHFRMLKATTKHKGFGIPPRQDPRLLRSHKRRWDGGAKVSRSSDRIHPPPDNDVGRSKERLRLLVFKIKIFKDSLCSVFRLLKIFPSFLLEVVISPVQDAVLAVNSLTWALLNSLDRVGGVHSGNNI